MAEEQDSYLGQGLKRTLTPQEYQTSFVDFYTQTLGRTGVEVEQPDDEKEEDKKEYVAPQIITDSGGDDFVSYGQMGQGTKELDIKPIDVIGMKQLENINSYSDLLKSQNQKDIVELDNFDFSFSRPSEKSLKKSATITGGALMQGMGLLGADLAGSIIGDERKEIDGKTGFRPTGGMGYMYDLNMNNQVKNIAAIRDNLNYNLQENEAADIAGTTPSFKPVGFSARVNGQLVSRSPGSINFDGVYDYTAEQMKNLDALIKGKNPIGYNLQTEQSTGGGVINTQPTRGYTERGGFATVNGISATGLQSDFNDLVDKTISTYNLNVSKFDSRGNITSQYSKLSEAVRDGLTKTRNENSVFSTRTQGKGLTQNIRDSITGFIPDRTPTQTETTDTTEVKTTPPDVVAQVDSFTGYTPPTQSYEYDGGDSDSSDTGTGGESMSDYGDADEEPVAMGGRIGMREGGNTTEVVQPAGFIAPDPNATDQQEIADDKPMDAKEGDFIINAPAAEEAGKQDIQRMITTAVTNLQEKGVDVRFGNPKMNIRDRVKLLVSRNEVYIPAIIAKEIGYDRLKKINNRGKREVQRRQEQAQQQPQQGVNLGGFIQKKKGDVVQQGGFIPTPVTRDMATFTLFKDFLKKKKPLRADIEELIDRTPDDKNRLSLLAATEISLSGSKPEEIEAVIQTIVNRVNDKTFEYRNVNTIPDAMKQRSRRGTGSGMFMYDGLERRYLTPRLKEIVRNPKVFEAGQNAAENVLTKGGGEPDYETEMLPPDIFQYSVEGKPSEKNEQNPKLRFYKQIGKHRFYQRVR